MSRLVLLLAAALALSAAEYAPVVDRMRLYEWTTTQGTQWESAGDKLRFDTSVTWQLSLRCASVDGPRMKLKLLMVAVSARHHGPGIDVKLDSATGEGVSDPLLGHWLLLAGRTLTLDVDRATGAVAPVPEGAELIAEVNRAAPPAIVGDPPPLDAQARAAFSPEALASVWSQALALPAAGSTVPLPAPFTAGATMTRTWTDLGWSLALPAGDAPAFELAKDPNSVRGKIAKLSGSGRIVLTDGLPASSEGDLAFTLEIDALTQPVKTENTIHWSLRELP